MRKPIAILLLILMFLQTFPALNWLSPDSGSFYSLAEEEIKEKIEVKKVSKDCKEFFYSLTLMAPAPTPGVGHNPGNQSLVPAPFVNDPIQPPDASLL